MTNHLESSFIALEINRSYSSEKDDLLNDFYIPCLEKSVRYSRVTGFFTSSSLQAASKGVASLLKNGGKMRILTSPHLTHEDVEAINAGTSSEEKVLEEILVNEVIEALLHGEGVEALSKMIASGLLEIRLALMYNQKGVLMNPDEVDKSTLFHDKMGILEDSRGNKISFSGSINETGQAWLYNNESFKTFSSWNPEQSKYVKDDVDMFEAYWPMGSHNKFKVVGFPEAVKQKWIEYAKKKTETDQKTQTEKRFLRKPEGNFSPRPYQSDAIENWVAQGYRGLFDMATGTGKTKTALLAAERLFSNKGKMAIVITCPFLHLTEMWVEELKEFGVFNPIIGHSQSKDWQNKLKNVVRLYNDRGTSFVFITTVHTFCKDFTQEQINKIKGDVLIIADEVHRLGASGYRNFLNPKINYRIGLSATIDRRDDPSGTQALYSYFGEKCIYYPLSKALEEKMLTPYLYYPIQCYYNEKEYEQIISINNQIQELSLENTTVARKKIKELSVNGYTIMAKMEDKQDKLIELLRKRKNDNKMLVYCGAVKVASNEDDFDSDDVSSPESERLIKIIMEKISKELEMAVVGFTYEKTVDQRKRIIEDFCNNDIQAIVAIRCLDEGVNIPGIETAFILSSSDDPKEYIQRRGRVLRLSEGKERAIIYDFLAMPRNTDYERAPKSGMEMEMRLIARELKRVFEFSKLSENKGDSVTIINKIANAYGVEDIEGYVNECK